MIKKESIPQIAIISANSLEQLQDRINQELMNHPSAIDVTINEKNMTGMLKYNISIEHEERIPEAMNYVVPDHHIELTECRDPELVKHVCLDVIIPLPQDYHCCDCEHYDWGNGCIYSEGRRGLMDNACAMFNVQIIGADGARPKRISIEEDEVPATALTANLKAIESIECEEE